MPSRNEELMQLRNQHVPQGLANTTTAFITKAHGAIMVDADGRELIDFAGGLVASRRDLFCSPAATMAT